MKKSIVVAPKETPKKVKAFYPACYNVASMSGSGQQRLHQ